MILVEKNDLKIESSVCDFIISKNVKLLYNLCDILLIKKMWFLHQCIYLLICILLYVDCSHRHVPDALVSLHAFFPVVPTELLYCDTADSPWIQTVWSNACRNKQKNTVHTWTQLVNCGKFHWKPVWIGTVVQNTMIIYSIININNWHYRGDQSKQKNQWGRWRNMFTAHVTVVLSHTISIRVGTRCEETLNPTCLTERVFWNVNIKSVRGQIIWPLGGRETKNIVNLLKCFQFFIKLYVFTCKSLKLFPGTMKWWFCFFIHMLQLEKQVIAVSLIWFKIYFTVFTVIVIYFDYFCKLQTSIMVLWHSYQLLSCTYLQSKTWRSREPQTSNLTAPQWQPPVCFTSSICRSKRDRHDYFTWVGIWAFSLQKPYFHKFNHKEQKEWIWPEGCCCATLTCLWNLLPLVTTLNTFNHSPMNQAKDH